MPKNQQMWHVSVFQHSPNSHKSHLIVEDVRAIVHIWSFLSKMFKLLFKSENNSKVRPKYSKTCIKSRRMIVFLHRRHCGRFYEYIYGNRRNILEKTGDIFQRFHSVCRPHRIGSLLQHSPTSLNGHLIINVRHIWCVLFNTSKLLFTSSAYCWRRSNHCSHLKKHQ